jgi:hypothetical protein
MKRAIEFLKNLFKALIFDSGTRLRRGWFFFIKKKEQINHSEKEDYAYLQRSKVVVEISGYS